MLEKDMSALLAVLKIALEKNLGPIDMSHIKDVCNEMRIKIIKEEISKRLQGLTYKELTWLEKEIEEINKPKTIQVKQPVKKNQNYQ